MDVKEHAARMSEAMNRLGITQRTLVDATGKTDRTIRNWLSGRGKKPPTLEDRVALRAVLGDYDAPGDPVERAVRESGLTEDRQYEVIGFYKRKLREQRDEFPDSP